MATGDPMVQVLKGSGATENSSHLYPLAPVKVAMIRKGNQGVTHPLREKAEERTALTKTTPPARTAATMTATSKAKVARVAALRPR